MGIERRLVEQIAKKYPQGLHKHFQKDAVSIPSERMEFRMKNEKKLIQVLSNVPHWGIGRIVTSMEWPRTSAMYWRISRVFVDYGTENFEYGSVWGVFNENGRSLGYEEEIPKTNEPYWRLIPKYDEKYFVNFQSKSNSFQQVPLYIPLPPLLSKMYKMKKSTEDNCKSLHKTPMVRLLVDRDYINDERQLLDNGKLV